MSSYGTQNEGFIKTMIRFDQSFYFGEEFIIFLPNYNLKKAKEIAERVRLDIENIDYSHIDENLVITSSFGVSVNKPNIGLKDILSEAQKLPKKQKLVFFMRFQNDLKLDEIAKALSVDVGTVKGYLSRSIKRIREELEIL